MLRDRSPIEALLTYATFFALSLALHLLVILGGRERPPVRSPFPGEAAAVTSTASPLSQRGSQ